MRRRHESSTCEVLVDGQWHECPMSRVDAGDVFRVRGPDGRLYRDAAGESVWRCTEAPVVQREAVNLSTGTEGPIAKAMRLEAESRSAAHEIDRSRHLPPPPDRIFKDHQMPPELRRP